MVAEPISQHELNGHASTILVATDFSPGSDEALRQGDRRARALGSSLVVCTVVPSLHRSHVLFPHRRAEDSEAQERLRAEALEALTERTRQITGRETAEFRTIVDDGPADERIIHHAERERASMVVVGSRGTSGI